MRKYSVLFALLLASCSQTLQAASSCTSGDGLDRPRIGLALGGGGARGLSHIGVIRVLEELRVPVDYVAGTSMGSIVGGLYATGMDSTELEASVQAVDWKTIFDDDTARPDRTFRRKRDDNLELYGPRFGVGEESSLLPSGAVSGQKITLFFQEQVSQRVQDRHFDDLPIPYRAIAADIINGEAVVMDEGDLALAMRSSMSIPGLFAPVPYQNHKLVDGGIANNLPVSVVRDMGADIIIAIDVGTPLHTPDELDNMLTITSQLSGILVQRNTWAQRELLSARDVLVEPELGSEISSADFTKGERAIEIGLAAGHGVQSQLAGLGISEDAYARHRAGIRSCVDGVPTIQFVKLENHTRFSDAVIQEKLNVALGKPLDDAQLEEDMAAIFALGFIEWSNYEVVEEDGRHGIRVLVKQDSRGTNFIETGGSLSGSNGSNQFEVRLAYLKTDMDDKGSEFRAGLQIGDDYGLTAELYKPLGNQLRYIVLPRVIAERNLVNLFDDDGEKLAEAEVKRLVGSLGIGRELSNKGALFGGILLETGDIDIEVGPPIDTSDFDGGKWFVSGDWDTLDDRFFPVSGDFLKTDYTWSRDALGADEEYEQLRSKVIITRSFEEKHSFMGGFLYETTISGTAPLQDVFRGGGFFRMSGFEPNELSGQHFGMGLIGYRYKLADIPLVTPYVGATLEYGNAVKNRDDIIDEGIWNGSVYIGAPSFIGPLYLGYGWRENDSGVLFLRLGTLF